jgi:rRNA-processing protein FCF1
MKLKGQQTRKQRVVSFATRLSEDLQIIEGTMMALLDVSTIERRAEDPDSPIARARPDWIWGNTNAKQQKIQLALKKAYTTWFELFRVLFAQPTTEILDKISETDTFVRGWIEKESGWDLPDTIDKAKEVFHERIKNFYDLIDVVSSGIKSGEYVLVPDTNALVATPDVTRYSETIGSDRFRVIVLPTVIAELETLKIKPIDPGFREKVKAAIRYLKGLRNQGDPLTGVKVGKGITVTWEPREPDLEKSLSWLKARVADDHIIASLIEVQRDNPDALVVLVTSDVGLQNKAILAHIPFAEPPADVTEGKLRKKELLRVEARGMVDLDFPSNSGHREQLLVAIHNDDPETVTVRTIWLQFKGNKKIEMQTWGQQSLPLRIPGRDFMRQPVRCVVPHMEIEEIPKISKVCVTTSHEPNKYYNGRIENLAEFVEKLHESRIDPAYMTPEQRKQHREMVKKRKALQAKIARKNGFVGKYIGPDGWKVRP